MNGSSMTKLKTQITWKSPSANQSRVVGQVIDDSTINQMSSDEKASTVIS